MFQLQVLVVGDSGALRRWRPARHLRWLVQGVRHAQGPLLVEVSLGILLLIFM